MAKAHCATRALTRKEQERLRSRLVVGVLVLWPGFAQVAKADGPYFVTYNEQMEEPGSLEVAVNPVMGKPKNGNPFAASWLEFEYGTTGWWTTEFYLEGQSTERERVFTGWRLENRVRPLAGEHWINPVLYVEFEDINAASKTMQEVVGFDSQSDHAVPNSGARAEKLREIETKLILGSEYRGWNLSENLIAEKNLANAPWEFGYALGANRPLALAASPKPCGFCRENFRAGLELYGGLGDAHDVTFRGTSHYLAPVLSWELPNGTTFRISPTFGLTENSHGFLMRFGVSYEFPGFGRKVWERLR